MIPYSTGFRNGRFRPQTVSCTVSNPRRKHAAGNLVLPRASARKKLRQKEIRSLHLFANGDEQLTYLPVNIVVGLRLLTALSRQHSVVRAQSRIDEPGGRSHEGNLRYIIAVDQDGG